MQFFELFFRDLRWRAHHGVADVAGQRKRDDFGDFFFAGENAYEPVNARGNAAVRGNSVFKSFQHVRELRFLFFGESNKIENFLLHLGVMDPDAAAADFHAV